MADIKNNLSATTDPSTANDASQGYAIGSTWFQKNSGVLWACTDATTGGALWIKLNFDETPWPSQELRTVDYVTSWSSSAPVADTLVMMPITLREKHFCDRIGIWLATPQTDAEVRLGIYRTDPTTNRPGSRKIDAGTVSLASGTGMKTITISQYFDPGVYWLAAVFKSVGTMPTVQRIGGARAGAFTTTLSVNPFNVPYRYLSAAFPYAALPSTAPSLSLDAGATGVGIALRAG